MSTNLSDKYLKACEIEELGLRKTLEERDNLPKELAHIQSVGAVKEMYRRLPLDKAVAQVIEALECISLTGCATDAEVASAALSNLEAAIKEVGK